MNVSTDPWGAVAAILRDALEAGAAVALSGGSTPRRVYEQVADADWSRSHVYFVDDRAVPPEDARSNLRLLREAIGGDPVLVHRIEGELGAEAAADRYDALLVGVQLDLVLLGMGPDGHTASLFPGRPELAIADRRVVAVPEAGMEPYVPRVTMTLPTINAAARKVFLVAGPDKRDPLARVAELPAGRVEGAEWFVDAEAAP